MNININKIYNSIIKKLEIKKFMYFRHKILKKQISIF